MKRTSWLWAGLAVTMALGPVAGHAQPKPKALKIAVVNFFSGSGGVVGGPTVDSAKLTEEEINKSGGVDGVPIAIRFVDESGGPTKQAVEFRSLAGHVAAVIGYTSSTDCLAVAPLAKELHVLTIFSDCNGEATYEGAKNPWVFNTEPSDETNAVAIALYVAKMHPHIKTIAGINADYAFGREEWKYFTVAMERLDPGIKVGTALFPALFSGQYTADLSRLQAEHPDLIFSSNWGGDLVALVQQASAQGIFATSQFAFATGTGGGIEALKAMPAGVIAGADGGHLFYPGKITNPKLAAFVAAYRKRTHEYPIALQVYLTRRAIITLVAGYKAALKDGKGRWPTPEDVSHSLVGLHVTSLRGSFTIRSDHVATAPEWVGVTVRSSTYPFTVFNKIIEFPSDMILPPVGEGATQWVKSLTPAVLAHIPAPRVYQP